MHPIPSGPFDYERHALRWILKRLLGENRDLETLCKLIPRIANSTANLARAESVITGSQPPEEMNVVREALRELIEEHVNETREEAPW